MEKKNLVIDAKEAVLLQTSLLSYKNALKDESCSDKSAVSFEAPADTIKSIDQALKKISKTFSCDDKKKKTLLIERNGMMLPLDTVIGAFNIFCRKYRDCEPDVISLIGYSFNHDEIYEIGSGSNILPPQITTAIRLKTLLQVFCQALGNGNDPVNNERFSECIAQIGKNKGMEHLNVLLTAESEHENIEKRIIRSIEERYKEVASTFSLPHGIVLSFPREKWLHLKEAMEDIEQMIESGKLVKQTETDKKCYRSILDKINESLNTTDKSHSLLNIRLNETEPCVLYDAVRMLRNLYFWFLHEFHNQPEHSVLGCRYFKLAEDIDEQRSDEEFIEDEISLIHGGPLTFSDYELENAVNGLRKLTEDAKTMDKAPKTVLRVHNDWKEYSRLTNLFLDAEKAEGKNTVSLSREDIILFLSSLKLLKAEDSKLYRDLSDNVMEQSLKTKPADYYLQFEV